MYQDEIKRATILLVDDEEAQIRLMTKVLERDGYTGVHGTTRSAEALRRAPELAPDLVVLDLNMPFPDGYAVLESLRALTAPGDYLPILVLTGDITVEARRHALALGATDFLTKPVDLFEARYRIRNLLQMRVMHRALARQNERLEERVREATAHLEAAHLETLERLAHAAEFRDDDTGRHTRRVGDLAAEIGRQLGMTEERAELLRLAAPLHDLGKLGVPDAVLLKPGPLTPEECRTARAHTTIGAEILSGGHSGVVRLAEIVALYHHERWDGAGYPHGLREREIPLEARIVAVADVYDALSHDRPYRPAWTPEAVTAHMRAGAGTHFDPAAVEALLAVLDRRAAAEGPAASRAA